MAKRRAVTFISEAERRHFNRRSDYWRRHCGGSDSVFSETIRRGLYARGKTSHLLWHNETYNCENHISARADLSYPAGHSLFLLAKLLYENPPEHITIVHDDKSDLSEICKKLPFIANVSVVQESEKYPLLNNKTTYYVCSGYMCLPPSNEYIFEKRILIQKNELNGIQRHIIYF